MSDLSIPPEFVCPISRDIMHDPVEIIHEGESYFFDKNCIDTWKSTPGGDKNPLTMLDGFMEARCLPAKNLKDKITEFQKENKLNPTSTELPELLPFSDYEQIQEDELVARQLHIEINGPPPGISRNIRLMNQNGDYHRIILNFINLMGEDMEPSEEDANENIDELETDDEIPDLEHIEDGRIVNIQELNNDIPELIDVSWENTTNIYNQYINNRTINNSLIELGINIINNNPINILNHEGFPRPSPILTNHIPEVD
jgi:hypothetical protein